MIKLFLFSILFLLNIQVYSKKFDHNSFVKEINGCWKVELYQRGKVISLKPKELNEVLKKQVCITSDKIDLFGSIVGFNPKFEIESKSTKEALWIVFRNTSKQLNINSLKMYVVDVEYQIERNSNSNFNISTLEWAFDGRYLIVGYGGYTFKLTKVKRKIVYKEN